MSIAKNTIERLKMILQVSDRVSMEQMRNALEMDKQSFDKRIFEWAQQFGFKIDGDYVKITRESADDLIEMLNKLDKAQETWEKNIASKATKVEDMSFKEIEEEKKKEEKERKETKERLKRENEARLKRENEERLKQENEERLKQETEEKEKKLARLSLNLKNIELSMKMREHIPQSNNSWTQEEKIEFVQERKSMLDKMNKLKNVMEKPKSHTKKKVEKKEAKRKQFEDNIIHKLKEVKTELGNQDLESFVSLAEKALETQDFKNAANFYAKAAEVAKNLGDREKTIQYTAQSEEIYKYIKELL